MTMNQAGCVDLYVNRNGEWLLYLGNVPAFTARDIQLDLVSRGLFVRSEVV